jgi:hypothetical protein
VAKQSKRKIKKGIVSQIEETFDLKRLNYEVRTKPIRNKSKLIGAFSAFLIYSLGYATGYYSWQHHLLDYEAFARLVWILMIPATVVGIFIWLLTTNRREYAVRQDVQIYIKQLESEGGLLWRFAPILSELKPNDLTCKEMIMASKEGNYDKMVPEDYSKAVINLYNIVKESGSRQISPETAVEFERNINSRT